jgi:hypothetical protein
MPGVYQESLDGHASAQFAEEDARLAYRAFAPPVLCRTGDRAGAAAFKDRDAVLSCVTEYLTRSET